MEEATQTAVRFAVETEGYSGPLDQLVIQATRGDIDLAQISVSDITRQFRQRIASEQAGELSDVADFLTLVARLVNLKAKTALPDGRSEEDVLEAESAVDDAGRRLAEYRLFKAAAEALLAEAAEEGAQSFLGMVAPEVLPVERLRIAPEKLAAAFRSVLERLNETEPLPVGMVTFSVEEMAKRIRTNLEAAGSLLFEEIFTGVATRLEAVALFLGLLELLRNAEVVVEQAESLGPIVVTLSARDV